jgi:hypothetical protein
MGRSHGPEMGWSHPGDRHLPPVLRPMLVKPGCRPIVPLRADQLDNSSWRGPTAVPFRSYAATAPSRPAIRDATG